MYCFLFYSDWKNFFQLDFRSPAIPRKTMNDMKHIDGFQILHFILLNAFLYIRNEGTVGEQIHPIHIPLREIVERKLQPGWMISKKNIVRYIIIILFVFCRRNGTERNIPQFLTNYAGRWSMYRMMVSPIALNIASTLSFRASTIIRSE